VTSSGASVTGTSESGTSLILIDTTPISTDATTLSTSMLMA